MRNRGADALAAQNEFRTIAEFIRSSPELFAYISEVEARPGASARLGAAVQRRDQILREAAKAHFTGMGVPEQARRLSRELHSYATRTWPRDRLQNTNPHATGTLKAMLYDAFRLRDWPLSARQIERAIRSERLSGEVV